VFLIYTLLKSYTSASDLVALLVSSVPALLSEIVTIVRHRQLDVLGVIVLVFLAISAVISFIGGDPKLLLVRESFLTVVLAVACVVSLLFPRPLFFYIIRYFATGNDPAKAPVFNSRWQFPEFRRYMRIITVVWGIVYLVEFPVRVFMVYHLSIQQYLAIGPIVFYAVTFAVIAFTIAYARHTISRVTAMRRQSEEREEASGETTGTQA
jgi:drug/metabolite transporter (DMT)-like permease